MFGWGRVVVVASCAGDVQAVELGGDGLGSAPRGFSQLTMKLRSRGSAPVTQEGPDLLGLAQRGPGRPPPGPAARRAGP